MAHQGGDVSEDGMVSVPLSWSERHEEVKAERDRLQAEKAHLVEVNAALRTRPDLAERAPLVVALVKERDELKELADGYATRGDALVEERDQLRAKADEADVELTEFVNLITPLLHGTANALKGEPPELVWHDWSDLPKVAGAVVTERDRLRAVLETIANIPLGGTTLISPPTVEHLQDVARAALDAFDVSAREGT